MTCLVQYDIVYFVKREMLFVSGLSGRDKRKHGGYANEDDGIMNQICKDIFCAIHEGKWLSIEYKNKGESITKYWIGIKDIDVKRKMLKVEGLHLALFTVMELNIYIDSILSSNLVDGTFFPKNTELIEKIYKHPETYKSLFGHIANLKILNYLEDCSRMDVVPYRTEFSLIEHFDEDCLKDGDGNIVSYGLNEEQFKELVHYFQKRANKKIGNTWMKMLALNVLSIHTKEGLYVLAYRNLDLDIQSRVLRARDEITVCREFTVEGNKQSIRRYLDGEDFELLDEFEKNQELIKDKIRIDHKRAYGVDDLPYVLSLGYQQHVNLHEEYGEILQMYEEERVTTPVSAFFGDLTKRPVRRSAFPIALVSQKVNLDQLLAIHNAMKYPLTYIQGPPGTGKTSTIINTLLTAFFNNKTVLFCSYNNHPIDGVFDKMIQMEHRGRVIPFPIVRLGNDVKVREALKYMKNLYFQTREITVFEHTLQRNKDAEVEKKKKLTELLKRHELRLELLERKEAIEKLCHSNRHLSFYSDLYGRQLRQIKDRLEEVGEVQIEEALELLNRNEEDFSKYLYYISAKYIKRISEPKNADLLEILNMESEDEQAAAFNRYMQKGENVKKLLRIFPIICTTCISAHKIGEPAGYFDMVIMDEASQCNTAISLVPILRGDSLMLVGDPQQLSPVIVLDKAANDFLKKSYKVSEEYDYIKNSIYKVFLAADSVSDEILLSHHYRCQREIIEFNNKKYYNGKLHIETKKQGENPLVYIDVEKNQTNRKNTAPAEAQCIVEYAKRNQEKTLGIITPFVNQKKEIEEALKKAGIKNVTCGTVHAFQGDEKDIIMFSLAVTEQTHEKTYNWLKNNRELINVATSRAKEQLVLLSSEQCLEKLHITKDTDDLYELVQYVKTNGQSRVTGVENASRALGTKPYSTKTEAAFLETLNHALDNVIDSGKRCKVEKEVAIAHVFQENTYYNDLFYTGRFDFVVYMEGYEKEMNPILAIELDGKEHFESEVVQERDRKKNEICRENGFELIRVENTYARRYHFIKEILIEFFAGKK